MHSKSSSEEDDDQSNSGDEEEYAMVVKEFKKFFKRREKFVRQPRNERRSSKNNRRSSQDEKKDTPKDRIDVVIQITSSDSGDENEEAKKETCLMALETNEVIGKNKVLKERIKELENELLENDLLKCKIMDLEKEFLKIKNFNEVLLKDLNDLRKENEFLKAKDVKEDQLKVDVVTKVDDISKENNLSNAKHKIGHKKITSVEKPHIISQFYTSRNDIGYVKKNYARFLTLEGIATIACLKSTIQDDEYIVDSGCTKHMTGNKGSFKDYEKYDGGHVTFGGNVKGK
ncbi:hypothetical protein L1987_60485 [Smallanthus sonchifolius]|uniref:Uncharacterized protein n=1 Tax=Smallanthus sonchifolius TaxID=185202 RepID=A0ACB9D861_9ASTR|nr:hypothetical protein L1987_60485 [Smallanthus sonchifolius]